MRELKMDLMKKKKQFSRVKAIANEHNKYSALEHNLKTNHNQQSVVHCLFCVRLFFFTLRHINEYVILHSN